MDLIALLEDRSTKSVEKRTAIAGALVSISITLQDIRSLGRLGDRQAGILLEAMEAVTRSHPGVATPEWLQFAGRFITSPSGSLKRESSRIVGNIAHLFPGDMKPVIKKLLANTGDSSTVVRWGSAYALARIVAVPQYADSSLFSQLTAIAENEAERGVKNQYLAGLKKAQKSRAIIAAP